MTRGRLIRQWRIYRRDLRSNPQTIYLFGDNLIQKGLGGQAREMRGEKNALGVPTKRLPSTLEAAFFTDEDLAEVLPLITRPFQLATLAIEKGYDVVIPADGLGTGLAELPKRAPAIAKLIDEQIQRLDEIASGA
jgi:hypothetical protein